MLAAISRSWLLFLIDVEGYRVRDRAYADVGEK